MGVELSSRARRDLRKLDSSPRDRIVKALRTMASASSANLDIKALQGQAPWHRLRVGTYRVIYRQTEDGHYLIARIIHRRDLERAVTTL